MERQDKPGAALAAALLSIGGTASAQGRWIATCDLQAAPGDTKSEPVRRIFRLGPNLIQEWSAYEKVWGTNHCLAFACVVQKDRLEGTISSRTVDLTITVDPVAGTAAWRAAGASGFNRSSGTCAVKPEPPAKAAG